MRPLLIGQAPSRRTDGMPAFSGATGRRIAEMAGLDEVRDAFDCENVFEVYPGRATVGYGDRFPIAVARRAARRLLPQFVDGRTVVLVGSAVARAFGIRATAPLVRIPNGSTHGAAHVYVLPHPSGLNRWYNVPENRDAASALLRRVVAESRVQT